jgi:hypothetical protein
MAVLHDFGCPAPDCDAIVFDVMTDEARPRCPTHDVEMEVTYLPKHYRPFSGVEVVDDATGQTRVLGSIHEVRSYEERTTKAWERGEPGARPVVFREFSQDRSNRDQNVFRHLKQQVDRRDLRTRNSRGIPFVTSRSGPAIPYEED